MLLKKNIKKNRIKDSLDNLFNYKKTTDTYNKSNKESSNKNDADINNLYTNDFTVIDGNENNNSKCVMKNEIVESFNFININDTNYIKYEYDEWDLNLNEYKKKWCKVFEHVSEISEKNKHYEDSINKNLLKYKKLILFFKEKLNFLVNKKEWIRYQNFGENIDIDTLIENYKSVQDSNFDKIYKCKKKTLKDLSIILLLDSSLSTDSYVKKIKKINFIKKLSLFISLILEKNVQYEVSCFYSNTRYDCRYIKLKTFVEFINKKMTNILNMSPCGYTRIGPAIRHASTILEKKKEKDKIILILTDGNPTDYDTYEGNYGIKDIKMAINECLNKKIKFKGILINDNINMALTNVLGSKNYINIKNISYKTFKKLFNFIFL
jgi:nitric oxide reductase NorD protein